MNTKEVQGQNKQSITHPRQKKDQSKVTNKNFLPKSINRLGGKRSCLEEIKQTIKSEKSIKSQRISKSAKITTNQKVQKRKTRQIKKLKSLNTINKDQIQIQKETIPIWQTIPEEHLDNKIISEERQNKDEEVVLLSQQELVEMKYSPESNQVESTQSVVLEDCQLGFILDEDSENILKLSQEEERKAQKQKELLAQQKSRAQISKFQLAKDSYNLEYLLQRNEFYKVDKIIIKRQNPLITPRNRSTLSEWLMEVSDNFHLKRQTYQLAMNYLDRYLEISSGTDLDQYQTLGITCLLMASKIEEIYFPKFYQYAEITHGTCTLQQILSIETFILIELKWLLNPITLNNWANYFMQKWDQYALENPLGLQLLKQTQDELQEENEIPFFKSDENRDYLRFRHVMQSLDLALTDFDHYDYEYRYLALSAIIIELALFFDILNFGSFNVHNQNNQKGTSKYLGSSVYELIFGNDQSEQFHLLVNFIESFCDIRSHDLKESIKYISLFYTLSLQDQLPEKLQGKQVATQEEFYAFQVYYKDQSKIYEKIQLLKKYNDSSLKLLVI